MPEEVEFTGMTIGLSSEAADMLDQLVDEGVYKDRKEAIRASLRLLEDQELANKARAEREARLERQMADAPVEVKELVRRVEHKWAPLMQGDRSGRIAVPQEFVPGIILGSSPEAIAEGLKTYMERGYEKHQWFHKLQCLLTNDRMTKDSYSLGDVLACLEDMREDGQACGLCDELLYGMRVRKDGAYEERNQLVALVARMAQSLGYTVGITKTDIPGWNEEWHGCVYIDLPEGQVSWHYHDSHAHFFEGLPAYEGEWDGHTTEEKYGRVNASFKSLVAEG